jgi:hypothetical protein
MKLTVTFELELDNKQKIIISKEQAEALYNQLGQLLNKNTPTPWSPSPNPAAPSTGPWPWNPGVTYRVGEYMPNPWSTVTSYTTTTEEQQ